MANCVGIPNIIYIGWRTAEVWRLVDFSRRQLWRRKSTAGCGFSDGTRLRKPKYICLPNFDEVYQSAAELSLLPVSENGRLSYWNSTSGFDIDLFIVIRLANCVGKKFILISQPKRSYDVISIFHNVCYGVANVLPIAGLGWNSVEKTEVYLHTIFWWDISIRGWVITTSVFGKQTSAILEFYLRFAIWSYTSLCRAALHNPTRFRRHVTIHVEVISFYLKLGVGRHLRFVMQCC